MDVWGEYLFLENFFAGYGILRVTAGVCGCRPGKLRLILGSAGCGIFSFILLAELPGPVMGLVGILFALFMVFAVFGPAKPLRMLRIAALFYLTSFLTGGCVMAFLLASGIPGIVCNGIIYAGHQVYGVMLGAMAAAWGLGEKLMKLAERAAAARPAEVELQIELLGRSMQCHGKVDTGNGLREPVSGKPVSVMEKKAAEAVWGDLMREHLLDTRIRVIPFSSVGCCGGSMMALRCDRVTISGREGLRVWSQVVTDTYIGLYDGVFEQNGLGEPYAVLVQPELLKGAVSGPGLQRRRCLST